MSDELLAVSTIEITSGSPAATQAVGQRLGGLVQPGDVLALSGDLGAGKTTLVQGIGAGLGVHEQITSPTFTLVGEALAFGLDDLLGGDGVTVIEWADLVAPALPADRLDVQLTWLDEQTRRLVFTAHGARHAELLRGLGQETTA